VQYVVEKQTVEVQGHGFYLLFLLMFCCMGCAVCTIMCRPRRKTVHPTLHPTLTKQGTVNTDNVKVVSFEDTMEAAWKHGTVDVETVAPAESKQVVVDFTPAGESACDDNEESEGGLYLDDEVKLYPEVEANRVSLGLEGAAAPNGTNYPGLKYVMGGEAEGHQETTSNRAQMYRAQELA